MAQRIQQLPPENMPYAQQSLGYSSTGQGLGAMTLPNPGMKNQMDGGAFSKPYANAQEQRNAELTMQNARQNEVSRQPQALAGAQGMARKEMVAQSDAVSKAQIGLNTTLANIMEQTGSGVATAQLADPAKFAQVRSDVAVSQAMNQKGAPSQLGRMMSDANGYA